MSDPSGNQLVLFSLDFSRDEVEGNIRTLGKTKLTASLKIQHYVYNIVSKFVKMITLFVFQLSVPGPPSKKNFPGFQNPEFPYNGMAGLRFSQGPDPVRRENKIAFRFYATFSRSSFCSRSLCAQFCESSSRFILLIFLVLS